jgi:hypothetical protein
MGLYAGVDYIHVASPYHIYLGQPYARVGDLGFGLRFLYTLNIGALPGALIIYFVITLTIHSLFFLVMFSCWVFFLPELGK